MLYLFICRNGAAQIYILVKDGDGREVKITDFFHPTMDEIQTAFTDNAVKNTDGKIFHMALLMLSDRDLTISTSVYLQLTLSN